MSHALELPRGRSDTVKFNVSGRIFEVLREPTLSLHPESLLHLLAEQQTDSEPIFIDANAELFQFILDYHRHRKIMIPYSVSKDALLRECAVFQISILPTDIVQQAAPLSDVGIMLSEIRSVEQARLTCSFAENKAATLSDLIVQCAMEKVGGDPIVRVTNTDLSNYLEEKGRVIASTDTERKMACPVIVNFLSSISQSEERELHDRRLRELLTAWGQQNGFDVKVRKGGPIRNYTFVPVETAATSGRVGRGF